MNNDASYTWYPTGVGQNVERELCCYSHYMKYPINQVHVVPKRKMKKHLRKVHNLDKFEPGLYGVDFHNNIF
jgi:hypothetical protein